jgi:hypothetical protein
LAWEKAREKHVFTLPAIDKTCRRESKSNILRRPALAPRMGVFSSPASIYQARLKIAKGKP